MVVDPTLAKQFIGGYSLVLSEIHEIQHGPPFPDFLNVLSAGRDFLIQKPNLLREAADRLAKRGKQIHPSVLRAIESIRVRQWVYLRDTTKGSILIAAEDREA